MSISNLMSGDHARIGALLDRLVKINLENNYPLLGQAFADFKLELSKHFNLEIREKGHF